MDAKLTAKAYWAERDITHLSTRFTNGDREISLSLLGWPTHTQKTEHSTTFETNRPSMMLWKIDSSGIRHDVTEGVLGPVMGGEYYPGEFLKRAMQWLLEAK